ncbi:hypothetical protein WMY93_015759 [Mugilogobius chulae]|uniref:Endonuclease/exonuclease/phosphatase domain-containing protein n=1 Tax=Mugilogobius chulae TaxID=88201 RepID=A0AAW0NTL3_9GOBI
MIVSRQSSSTKDKAGPSAAMSQKNNRGGTPFLDSRTASNDDAGLNPAADDGRLRIRGRMLKVGTWNVRTLNKPGQFENLKKEASALQIDILGLAETRWKDEGRISEEEYDIIYSGGEKHSYGVGILMRRHIAVSMLGFWPISERLIMMKISGAPVNVNIMQVYAPTSDHSYEELESFYASINEAMRYVQSGEVVIVMGDWNAKLGEEYEYPITGRYGIGERNERGEELAHFCRTNNFVVANTLFQHPKRRLYTWKSPGGNYRNQIDYILVNARFRNCIKQAKTYPGADIGSDHNPVVMKIKVKLKKLKKQKPFEHLELNKLKEKQYQENYNIQVQNMYNKLALQESPQGEEEEIEHQWNIMRESLTKAAQAVLPRKKKEAKQPWMTNDILQKMSERKKVKNIDPHKYYKLDKEIEVACLQARECYWDEMCSRIEVLEVSHRYREMYNKVKEITGESPKKTRLTNIRDKDGRMLFDETEIKQRWEEYITQLYNDIREEPTICLTEEGEDILVSEVEKAIRDLKAEKAAGPDQVYTEMLKALDEHGVSQVHELCMHRCCSFSVWLPIPEPSPKSPGEPLAFGPH